MIIASATTRRKGSESSGNEAFLSSFLLAAHRRQRRKTRQTNGCDISEDFNPHQPLSWLIHLFLHLKVLLRHWLLNLCSQHPILTSLFFSNNNNNNNITCPYECPLLLTKSISYPCQYDTKLDVNNDARRLVGIVGGIGPAASIRLQQLVLERDQHQYIQQHDGNINPQPSGFLVDSLHTPYILYNNPRIPNCNLGALGLGPSPVPALIETCLALERAGATELVFCCTTAYSWLEQVQQSVKSIPIVNLLDIIASEVEHQGHTCVGLLDVDGTLAAGRFQAVLQNNHNLHAVLPTKKEQRIIMKAVSTLKSGNDLSWRLVKKLLRIVDHLQRRGATAVILGCTEISTALAPLLATNILRDNHSSQHDLEINGTLECFDSLSIMAGEICKTKKKRPASFQLLPK